jgi:flagellar biosynthetic protein FliR
MGDLETFLTTGVLAFMMAFVRIGTAIMILPGIGNTFVPPNIRLYFALGFAFVFFPVIQTNLPAQMPSMPVLLTLLMFEFVVGMFIGMVARVLMSALDVAGMIVSMQSSLANAQLFNPAFSSQGSVLGTFLTLGGILLMFTTDLHHLMILGIVRSYDIFPVGDTPDVASMSELLTNAVAGAFMVGIQITAPFLVLILLLYIGMGIMSKLMPQVQVFMIAIPVQIYIALVTLALVISGMMLVWLDQFEKGMKFFLLSGG